MPIEKLHTNDSPCTSILCVGIPGWILGRMDHREGGGGVLNRISAHKVYAQIF